MLQTEAAIFDEIIILSSIHLFDSKSQKLKWKTWSLCMQLQSLVYLLTLSHLHRIRSVG